MTDLAHLRAVVGATPSGEPCGLTYDEALMLCAEVAARNVAAGVSSPYPEPGELTVKGNRVRVIPDDWQTQCDRWASDQWWAVLDIEEPDPTKRYVDLDDLLDARDLPDGLTEKEQQMWALGFKQCHDAAYNTGRPSGWFKHWT